MGKVYKRLTAWLNKFDIGMNQRLLNDIPEAFEQMAKCLDLRRLARAALHNDEVEKAALRWLAHWITTEGKLDLPDYDALWQQHVTVRARLVARANELKGTKSDWFPDDHTRSGTVIMKELFTSEMLYVDIQDWMFLFEVCAAHTSNEAVVESMGNIIDQHVSPRRGLSPENYSREAFIHWNGPLLHRADAFLTASLNIHFKGNGPRDWNFLNNTQRADKLRFKHVSKVVDRVRSERSKLPFMEDPAQALSAPLDDASSPYCLDTSDATGILHDSDGEGDGPTHEEQGTWRVEEVRKYRFNRRTRRDEWLIKWQGWPERSDTWEPLGHLTSDEVRQAAIKRKEQE